MPTTQPQTITISFNKEEADMLWWALYEATKMAEDHKRYDSALLASRLGRRIESATEQAEVAA